MLKATNTHRNIRLRCVPRLDWDWWSLLSSRFLLDIGACICCRDDGMEAGAEGEAGARSTSPLTGSTSALGEAGSSAMKNGERWCEARARARAVGDRKSVV